MDNYRNNIDDDDSSNIVIKIIIFDKENLNSIIFTTIFREFFHHPKFFKKNLKILKSNITQS